LDTFAVYIMNAGVGGYLSSRDINPLIKRDGQKWEKWSIQKSGSKYTIQDHRCRCLTARASGLVEFRTWLSSWEKWEIMRVSGDAVSIKSHHGRYLKADKSGFVFANAGSANDWEEWRITNNNDIKGSGPDGEWVIGGAVAIVALAFFSRYWSRRCFLWGRSCNDCSGGHNIISTKRRIDDCWCCFWFSHVYCWYIY
jgi:hypothetical protein